MSLTNFFNPLSIAVVGASRDSSKIGTIVVQNLLDGGYTGTIYPINPHAEQIAGLSVYPTLADCPAPPELVIISLPVEHVLSIVEQIVKLQIKYAVVLTAGFKEVGDVGAALEQQIKSLAQQGGVTLLGPNCLGFASVTNHVNATFAEIKMIPGSLKLISQSGAIASAFFDRSQSVNLGVDACVTIGNKASLSENDFLSYRQEYANQGDPIGLYLESISDGQKFMQITKQLTKKNPVFLLKPGKSHHAQLAMQSHTGSIAGEDNVLSAACEQAGIIRCSTIQDLFDLSMYFSRQPAPKGKRVAIVSNAGGPAVITTDLLADHGLEVAQLSDATQKKLTEFLPRAASVHDPIDLLGDAQADRYTQAVQTIIEDEKEVDAIIVILTPQVMTQIEQTAQSISQLSEKYEMPIVATFIGNHHVIEGQKILHAHHVPCFSFPERAVWTLAKAQKQYTRQTSPSSTNQIPKLPQSISLPSISGLLGFEQTQTILRQLSIPTPADKLVGTIEEVKAFVHEVGYPVVMKLLGKQLLHKTDIGGVISDIWNEETLQDAFVNLISKVDTLRQAGQVTSIQLQKQIQDGIELIIGYKKDPIFGDLLMIGPGGTLTNILHDHQMRVLPATKDDLQGMLERSPLRKLLQGYRGHKPYAIDQLLTFLEGFVQLVQSTDRIDQAEINPIIVTTDGVYAVDPKIVLL